MNDLRRELAPISDEAWATIDEEARRTLRVGLGARRVVDFTGPLGWTASAASLGRVESLRAAPGDGVEAARRLVQPLVELRAPFALSRAELDCVGRGAADVDLAPVTEAASRLAMAEDRAVFHGYAAGGIKGIVEAAGAPVPLTDDYHAYPNSVVAALGRLRAAGVDGPYAVVLGARCYTGLSQTVTPAGFPVMEHVRRLIDGPLVWAPAVDGAVVLSTRGGDFSLTVGQDFSVGYLDHTASEVRLYLQESMTFRALVPEAAVALAYSTGEAGGRRRR